MRLEYTFRTAPANKPMTASASFWETATVFYDYRQAKQHAEAFAKRPEHHGVRWVISRQGMNVDGGKVVSA